MTRTLQQLGDEASARRRELLNGGKDPMEHEFPMTRAECMLMRMRPWKEEGTPGYANRTCGMKIKLVGE